MKCLEGGGVRLLGSLYVCPCLFTQHTSDSSVFPFFTFLLMSSKISVLNQKQRKCSYISLKLNLNIKHFIMI